MNSWKTLWESYHQGASKSAYARELWVLSSYPTRAFFAIATVTLIWAFANYAQNDSSDWYAFPLMVVAEVAFIVVLDYMRGKTFSDSYGNNDLMLGPAENEDHRVNRYLIFRKRISSAGLTRSHVNELFDVLDAKIELENHRNERLNKFFIFVSGLLTALVISWIRGLTPQQSAIAFMGLTITVLTIGPVLWMLPSRKEKLKELKYFMRLFARSIDLSA